MVVHFTAGDGIGDPEKCRLCGSDAGFYHQDQTRCYYQCGRCRLVFVSLRHLPTRDTEKQHYDLHQNSPADIRYRRFLNRLFEPLNDRLPPQSQGLDFGCGPGPTLSVMFQEAGHSVEIFDPFYEPDRAVLQNSYDFVTASEVVEHFHYPGREFSRIWSLVRHGGWLGVMTRLVRDPQSFASWHYKLDPTHVSFFSLETFSWLAGQFGTQMTVAGDDVVLFQRTERIQGESADRRF